MKFNKVFKLKILAQLHEQLALKIRDAHQAVSAATDSRNNNTKSSAGDKHETGRAMMQMEIDTVELQLNKALQQQKELFKIVADREYTKVVPGSLVITDHESYFISIGAGKVIIDDQPVYAISLASPVGLLLKGKATGEEICFSERVLVIRQIL